MNKMRTAVLFVFSAIVCAEEPLQPGLGPTDAYVRTLYQKTGSDTWIPQDDKWNENSDKIVEDLSNCVVSVQEKDRTWPKMHELVSGCMHVKGYKLYKYAYE